MREVFRTLSDDVKFEFEYLSDVLPAYCNADVSQGLRVWGYGELEKDKTKGFTDPSSIYLMLLTKRVLLVE